MVRDHGDDRWSWGASSWASPYCGADAAAYYERAARRVASYHRDVANLVRQGSAEPRLWIGALESLWSGIAEDYGDALRRSGPAGDRARPVEVANRRLAPIVIRINESAETEVQSFEI